MRQVKQEIKLSEGLVATMATIKLEVKGFNEQLQKYQQVIQEIQQLQNSIKLKNDQFANLISGVCLNEGLNMLTDGIYFSDDMRTVYVYELPKEEVTEVEDEPVVEPPIPSRKVKKMK